MSTRERDNAAIGFMFIAVLAVLFTVIAAFGVVRIGGTLVGAWVW